MGRGPDLKPRKPRAEHIAGKDMIPPSTARAVVERIAGADLVGSTLQRANDYSPPIVKALGRQKVTADRVARRIAHLGEVSYKRAIDPKSTAKDLTTAMTIWRNIARLRGDWGSSADGNGPNQPQIPPHIVVQIMQVLREDSPACGDVTVVDPVGMGVDNASAGYAPTKNPATTVLDSPLHSPSAPCPDADNLG